MPRPAPDAVAEAKRVLAGNRADGFTEPARGLYPHQWAWDSAFIVIGYARYDQAAAERELRSLFSGQWRDGRLPHIVYHHPENPYFPHAGFWDCARSGKAPDRPLTSGIVQPPLQATAALALFDHASDPARARTFLAWLSPKLEAWHAYLHRERVLPGEVLAHIVHPWESGEDNSPMWDPLLRSFEEHPEPVPQYARLDTRFVNKEERPDAHWYDWYVHLARLAREADYDDARLARRTPFLVQDVLFNAILARAERDLASILEKLGQDGASHERAADRLREAMNRTLWDDRHGIYLARDLKGSRLLDVHVGAGFTPLFGRVPDAHRARALDRYLTSAAFAPHGADHYAVPSYDQAAPGFSGQRYWRGPVWISLNWLIYVGLREYGLLDAVPGVRDAILHLPAAGDFAEYYSPKDGHPLGARRFSWSASLFLDVAYGGG